MSAGKGIVMVALLLGCVAAGRAAPAAQSDPSGYTGVQMTRGPQNHLLLQMRVNGRPATFLLDTGADLSFFRADRAAAFGIRLTEAQTFRKGRSFPLGSINDLAAGSANLGATDVALSDASQFRGTAAGPQRTVDGVIGLDLLRRHKALINCHTRQLFLRTDPNRRLNLPATTRALGFVRIPLDINRRGTLTVPCSLRGRPARLIVDTGAFVTGLDDDALRFFSLTTRASNLTTRGFDGQIRPVRLAQIDDLKIGGVAIAPQTFAVMDLYGKKKPLRTHTGLRRLEIYAERSPAERILGLLGNDLLDQRRGIIDLDSMSLFLK